MSGVREACKQSCDKGVSWAVLGYVYKFREWDQNEATENHNGPRMEEESLPTKNVPAHELYGSRSHTHTMPKQAQCFTDRPDRSPPEVSTQYQNPTKGVQGRESRDWFSTKTEMHKLSQIQESKSSNLFLKYIMNNLSSNVRIVTVIDHVSKEHWVFLIDFDKKFNIHS